MGFLRRLAGSRPSLPPRPALALPSGEYTEVAGVIHHMGNLGSVFGRREESLVTDLTATLEREPANRYDPNAVRVLIEGILVGYLPRDHAAGWNASLARIESQGHLASVDAHLWYRWSRDDGEPRAYVHVWLDNRPIPPRSGAPSPDMPYANSACPYCGAVPKSLPKAKSKCKACGQSIHVKAGPDNQRYLLQEADLAEMERAWEDAFWERNPLLVRPTD